MRITIGSACLAALALTAPRAHAHEFLHFEHLQGGVVHAVTLVTPDLGFTAEDGGRIRRWTRDTVSGKWSFEHLDSGYDSRYLLRDIRFGDLQNGWAVGYGGRVVRTTDGGGVWSEAMTNFLTKPGSSELADLYAVRFVWDSAAALWRGWVVGFGGTLYTSADAGDTWTALPLPAGFAGNDLYGLAVRETAPGVFRLWVSGDFGTLLRSPDGGASWDVQHNLPPAACPGPGANLELWDIEMRDPNIGVVVGGVGNGCGESFYTGDGGVTWNPITCFSSGGAPAPHSAWSTDYGVTLGAAGGAATCGYASQLNVLTAPPLCWLNKTNAALSYLGHPPTFGIGSNGNSVIQTGMFNLVRTSDDGGLTWRNAAGVDYLRARDAACVTDQVGCIVGQGFRVLRSIDGMQTLTQVHIGPVQGPAFNGIAVSPVQGRNWLAVGDLESGYPYVAKSQDQGQTWTRLPQANFPPHLGGLVEVAFHPALPQRALVCGFGGRVLDTTNLGGTFTNWNSGITGTPDLRSIAFTSAGDAFVAGTVAGGFAAWRSVGGANAWSGVPLKDTSGATLSNVALNAIAAGAGEVWAVANGGLSFRYDATSNELRQVVPTTPPYDPTEDLVGVAIYASASETHVILGGAAGGIRYTNGSIWTSPRSRLSSQSATAGIIAGLSSIQVFPMPGNPDGFRGYVFGRQIQVARFVGPGANW